MVYKCFCNPQGLDRGISQLDCREEVMKYDICRVTISLQFWHMNREDSNPVNPVPIRISILEKNISIE